MASGRIRSRTDSAGKFESGLFCATTGTIKRSVNSKLHRLTMDMGSGCRFLSCKRTTAARNCNTTGLSSEELMPRNAYAFSFRAASAQRNQLLSFVENCSAWARHNNRPRQSRNRILFRFDVNRQTQLAESRGGDRSNRGKRYIFQRGPPRPKECHKIFSGGRTCERNHSARA